MAIDSISPVMSASPLTSLSRPPETTPNAREAAAQDNDARRNAEAVSGASPAALERPAQESPAQNAGPTASGTRVPVVATTDAEGTLREASSQIARASAGPETSAALRNASEAYQSEASARDMVAKQQQNNGATSINVLA
jgi:hypothetical protein